jgi:hypothetical protein
LGSDPNHRTSSVAAARPADPCRFRTVERKITPDERTVSEIPNDRGEGLVDTLRVQETPEGIDLELRVAGPVARAAALAVDALI